MLTRTYLPRQLVRHLYGTEPFADYCQQRGIGFPQVPGHAMGQGDETQWRQALHALPESEQARVELELAQVNELADPHAIALLTEACNGNDLPPDSVTGDAARSLWFFLHHPTPFREVLLRQEVAEIGTWRVAQGPAVLPIEPMLNRREALAESLREFFLSHDGSGQYCVVEGSPLTSSVCFTAHLADRLALLDVFTEEGEHATRAARPAVPLLFVYEPTTGRILLKSRLRSHERIRELVQRFGQAVLGAELPSDCLKPLYQLDILKRPFDPPLDAPDMESARVKALHFAYPERSGRRRVKLETLVGDSQHAIGDLLRTHAAALDELTVVYAELEIGLRIDGRRKFFVIRLWPDRTSLSQTSLGRRFYACLSRWRISHAVRP
jgi:hypothetical protein